MPISYIHVSGYVTVLFKAKSPFYIYIEYMICKRMCYIAMIRIREICGYVKTFTFIGIPKYTRNTDDLLGSRTKLLLPS